MDLAKKHCVPCEGGTSPLTEEQEDKLFGFIRDWELLRDEEPHKLKKTYKFKSFLPAMEFVNKVAEAAEEQQHHPDIHINYNRVTITLYTHAIKGLSENDFILAAIIDEKA